MRWFNVRAMSIMALGLSTAAALMPTIAHAQIFVANYQKWHDW